MFVSYNAKLVVRVFLSFTEYDFKSIKSINPYCILSVFEMLKLKTRILLVTKDNGTPPELWHHLYPRVFLSLTLH